MSALQRFHLFSAPLEKRRAKELMRRESDVAVERDYLETQWNIKCATTALFLVKNVELN